jgi:hypothetical protein
VAIANPNFVGKRIFFSLLAFFPPCYKVARTEDSHFFVRPCGIYRVLARHDVNRLIIYNSPASGVAKMPAIVVPVKPPFHPKAMIASSYLSKSRPLAPAFLSPYFLG